jgi:hypothetical protein
MSVFHFLVVGRHEFCFSLFPPGLLDGKGCRAVKENARNRGMKALVRYYRDKFRIPENTGYYEKKDLERAEKKFIRHCLTEGGG